MARTNKYTSINFNHVYEKSLTSNPSNNQSKHPNSSSPSPNGLYKSLISSPNAYKTHLSSGSHGRMLVLTRPAPKTVSPIAAPSPPSKSPSIQQSEFQNPGNPRSEPGSDPISLRPLGRTGAAGVLTAEREKEVVSPKPEKFVPPHLRPGFAGREARPGPEVLRGKEVSHRQPPKQQPLGYGGDGRPKSGGYDRRGNQDPSFVNRPRSSGYRPNSSG